MRLGAAPQLIMHAVAGPGGTALNARELPAAIGATMARFRAASP